MTYASTTQRFRPGRSPVTSLAALLAVPVLTLTLSGCPGTPEDDAGVETDAGAVEDAGVVVDGGTPEPGLPPIDAGPTEGDVVVNVENNDGTTSTVVAATGRDPIYFSFETKDQVLPADPMTSDAWDLGFLRFNIGVNGGGYFGNANGAVAPLDTDVTFAEVTTAPEDGYLTDLEDDDLDGNPEFIMGDETLSPWYAYDEITHVLTATDRVYVIRTDHSGYFAMVVTGYYNEDGDAGFMQFTWKPIDPPGGVDGGVADAGPSDSGVADSGVADGGVADSGVADSGVADSGVTDGGESDAGASDAGA